MGDPELSENRVDSVESATLRRAARWLEEAGADVPRGAGGDPDIVIEIAPPYALDANELRERISESPDLLPGETVYIA